MAIGSSTAARPGSQKWSMNTTRLDTSRSMSSEFGRSHCATKCRTPTSTETGIHTNWMRAMPIPGFCGSSPSAGKNKPPFQPLGFRALTCPYVSSDLRPVFSGRRQKLAFLTGGCRHLEPTVGIKLLQPSPVYESMAKPVPEQLTVRETDVGFHQQPRRTSICAERGHLTCPQGCRRRAQQLKVADLSAATWPR